MHGVSVGLVSVPDPAEGIGGHAGDHQQRIPVALPELLVDSHDRRDDFGCWPGGELLQAGSPFFQRGLDDRRHQVILAAAEAVEGAPGEPRGEQDLLHADRGDPLFRHQAAGDAQQAFPDLVAAVHDLPADDSLPPPWLSHCVSHPDVLPAWPSRGLA